MARTRHGKTEQIFREQKDMLAAFTNPANFNEGAQQQTLQQKYPDVPAPYNDTWDRSDESHSCAKDWKDTLLQAATALEKAAALCHQLARKKAEDRTTPSSLRHNKILLRTAINRAEDIFVELGYLYPLPKEFTFSSPSGSADPADDLPKLLLCSDDRIAFWLPRLPSKSRRERSLSYRLFKDLLLTLQLPHFQDWHCDFIHVFPPRDNGGIKDADNYAYKPIIDALTLALSTSDSTDHFSYSMYNHYSETIKSGSYIVISKRAEKVAFFTEFEKLVFSVHTTPE